MSVIEAKNLAQFEKLTKTKKSIVDFTVKHYF